MILNIKIKSILKALYKRLFPQKDKSVYISKISSKKPWVLIAYMADVFYRSNDISFMNSHQNKREALAMVPIFNRLGYNVYVQSYTKTINFPDINVSVIFGHPPAIEAAAKVYKKAIIVQYATGCFYTHSNKQEEYITNLVNLQCNTSFKCERYTLADNAHIISDHILMIGCKNTIETYPASVRHKITTLHQSSQNVKTLEHIRYSPENEYFFMSSSGVLLRGVPFLIDYFTQNQNRILHLICPFEPYIEYIQSKTPKNIIFHGIMNLGSDDLLDIVARCNFIIYPSGSEGGCPGSVINSMKNGLIPIVSQWSAFDEIDNYGYVMKDWSTNSIANGIEWAESIEPDKCELMKQKCSAFATQTYNLERFSKEFDSFFRQILKS